VGTVELGMDYGIRAPSDFNFPAESESIHLVRTATELGINLFDTAPSYNQSEVILGKALTNGYSCYVATKVTLPDADEVSRDVSEFDAVVMNSLQQSLCNLQLNTLDIVQIHNATTETFAGNIVAQTLGKAKEQGLVRFIGVSVYDESVALAAIESGTVDVLQIPFSILDQRPLARVLQIAKKANVGVMGRSVLLKGVLTPKARYLPKYLSPLFEAADRIRSALDISWEELPEIAIRYCLGVEGIDTVLLGVRVQSELETALDAVEAGPLPEVEMAFLQDLKLDDEKLLHPGYWGIP